MFTKRKHHSVHTVFRSKFRAYCSCHFRATENGGNRENLDRFSDMTFIPNFVIFYEKIRYTAMTGLRSVYNSIATNSILFSTLSCFAVARLKGPLSAKLSKTWSSAYDRSKVLSRIERRYVSPDPTPKGSIVFAVGPLRRI